jgi:hypothetical protein
LTYEINVQCYPGFYKWTFADCSTPPPFQLNASVFLFSPASQFVATAGDVPTGDLQIPLLGNLDRTYIGTILPVALPLGWSGAANTLQFPAADGDRVYLFDPATQNYKDVYTYFDGYGWNSANADDPGPLGPILQPGVGMIVEKAGPAVTWTFAYKKWQ